MKVYYFLKYKISETISIHIFITPSSPASRIVPSQASFSKIFFLRFIIRKNSLKISNISFFHIVLILIFLIPSSRSTKKEQSSREKTFYQHCYLLPLLRLLQLSNSASFSSTVSTSPKKLNLNSEQTYRTLRLTSFLKIVTILKLCILLNNFFSIFTILKLCIILINFLQVTQENQVCSL